MPDFAELFGREPEVSTMAPGRINLIGEHTDYNGGFVLPMAIPYETRIQLARRKDHKVRVSSMRKNVGKIFEYTLGHERSGKGWPDYVQGVTWVLGKHHCALHGFEALIDSSIPIGSGLSSSAALEVSLLRAIRRAFSLDLSDLQIAMLSQEAENEFVGARVGIMDQMAASLADPGIVLFIDTLSLEYQKLQLPPDFYVVVINSGVSHSNKAGQYNTRRAECEKACSLLGISRLRDLTLAELPKTAKLPPPLDCRVRHVVTENARVLRAAEAIFTSNAPLLGQLFNESHDSLRDDYAVSVPQIDLLVDIARSQAEVYGARLTGGGFGGSVVILTNPDGAGEVAKAVTDSYASQTSKNPTILVPYSTSTEFTGRRE